MEMGADIAPGPESFPSSDALPAPRAPPACFNGFLVFQWKRERGKSLCRAGAGSESMLRDELPFPLVNLKLFCLCFLLQVGGGGGMEIKLTDLFVFYAHPFMAMGRNRYDQFQ